MNDDPECPDEGRSPDVDRGAERLDLGRSPARESTGFLLAMAAHRFRNHFERALEPLKLQARHFGLLATIRHFGPVPQQRLVNSICIDRSTMVTLVDELEAAGLVQRQVDPDDRRAHRVHLTEAGVASHTEAHALMLQVEAELLSDLNSNEKAELRRLLAIVGDLDRSSGFEHINIRRLGRAE